MTGKGSSLIIAEKQLANATITVTSAQLKGINLVLTLIPFVVVMIGTAVFIRRRNR
jgi:Flp pilus assembly protein TadB